MRSLSAWLKAGVILSTFILMPSAFALEKVSLQLKWTHAYQFAGYYAAKEMGYYRDAGLNVDILPLKPGSDVVHQVMSGNANYGTGTSGLLLVKQDGAPVVVLAAIFQHSPYVIIARKFKQGQTIRDLEGKPIMLRRLSDELMVYLQREKINLSNVIGSAPGMDTIDQLKGGKVSAISGYVSNEPYILQSEGVPYEIYSPRAAGIDIYGDNLFTSEVELKKHPSRTERFRLASIKGWEYVLDNPDKAAEIIRKYDPSANPWKVGFEISQINPLIRSDFVSVGYMSDARWKHTIDIFKESGALNKNFDMTGFIYSPNSTKDLRLAYGATILLAIVLLIFTALGYYVYRINRRLKYSLEQASHSSQHDALTGLPNRTLFTDRLQRAILKAKRDKSLLALLFIDLDHLKQINDCYGHQSGDAVLKATANKIIACIRDSDSLGRIGGDEFVVLLEDLSSPTGALEVARKIQSSVTLPIATLNNEITTSVSIGIAFYPDDAMTEESLFKCADLAMYEAKQAGRNQIYLYSVAISSKV